MKHWIIISLLQSAVVSALGAPLHQYNLHADAPLDDSAGSFPLAEMGNVGTLSYNTEGYVSFPGTLSDGATYLGSDILSTPHSSFVLSIWFRVPTATGQSNRVSIFSTTDNPQTGFQLCFLDGYLSVLAPSGTLNVVSTDALSSNEWHLVTVMQSSTVANQGQVWLDGSLTAFQPDEFGTLEDFRLGVSRNGARGFLGDIAKVTLHDEIWDTTKQQASFEVGEASYIDSLSPDSAGQLGGTQITINGIDLCDGTLADIESITLNGIDISSIDSVSTTQIVITAASSTTTGTGDLVINSTARGTILKENAFTYLYEVPSYNLVIQTEHGIPTPANGTHAYDDGTPVDLSVTTPILSGSTQLVCTGWSADNGTSGATNAFNLTVTNDLALTWQWETNYWVNIEGTSVTGQWTQAGTLLNVSPLPKEHYTFSAWSGDLSSSENPLIITADGPIQLTAEYEALKTANTGTPHWWLAAKGYSGDFESAAVDNPDGDRLENWKEYVAGTDPQTYSSLNLQSVKNPTGRTVSWNAVSNRTYRVLWGTDLVNSSVTNVLADSFSPAANGLASIDDPRPEFPLMYYRVVVIMPDE